MKTCIILLSLVAAVFAVPRPVGVSNADIRALLERATSTTKAADETPAEAAEAWQSDTGVVSDFLNEAASLTGDDFTSAAAVALAAENDELVHMSALNAVPTISAQPAVASASNVLVNQGSFQDVVDLLQQMTDDGDSVAVTDTNAIDQTRCKNVLPNIDVFLKAAGTDLTSVRPTVCNDDEQVTEVTSAAAAAASTATTSNGNGNGNGNGDGNGNGNGDGNGNGNGNGKNRRKRHF